MAAFYFHHAEASGSIDLGSDLPFTPLRTYVFKEYVNPPKQPRVLKVLAESLEDARRQAANYGEAMDEGE